VRQEGVETETLNLVVTDGERGWVVGLLFQGKEAEKKRGGWRGYLRGMMLMLHEGL
jgi:hypothetical protein